MSIYEVRFIKEANDPAEKKAREYHKRKATEQPRQPDAE